ncbi:MAG: DUF3619 family protein [Rhodocyclaceae bacterium]|jgi:hypothetical protein
MTMNEQQERAFGLKVRNKLNGSTASMDPAVTERLFAARQAALRRAHQVRTEPVLVSLGHNLADWGRGTWRPLLLAAVLMIAAVGVDYWQTVVQARELEEVDSALLTNDLPINAYLDHGFARWLQDSGKR